MIETVHKPVLLQQTIECLQKVKNGVYIDATAGGGGHLLALAASLRSGSIIAIDRDTKALSALSDRLNAEGFVKSDEWYCKGDVKITLQHSDFSNVYEVIQKLGYKNVDGVIADLGMSSDQIDQDDRGFSFLRDDELDMRMNPSQQKIKASDLLNALYKKELVELFKNGGDVKFAAELANKIIADRNNAPIITAKQLKDIIARVVPFNKRTGPNKHPDAKVFQALRIAVNDEKNELTKFLASSFGILQSGGVIAVITFHSGEDRIVSKFFAAKERKNLGTALPKILPSEVEVTANRRSRSATLRAFKKHI